MKNGSCSATTVPQSTALPFVISTEAQRSGEICGVVVLSWKCFAHEPAGTFHPVNIIPPDTNPARDIFTAGTFGDGLLKAQKNYALKQTTVTRPAERELRLDLNQARPQGLQLEEVEDAC